MLPDEDCWAELSAGRKLLVCVGPGGVGKTTCAAAFGLRGARSGLRVAVVTVDPSMRLAQALGIGHGEGIAGQRVRVEGAGSGPDGRGSLEALVLDGSRVFETIVRSCASSPAGAEKILKNRMYQALAQRLSGATEYAAMAQVQMLNDAGAHDLIILDTPPTANAIDFLRAPARLRELVESPAVGILRGSSSLGARAFGLGAGVVVKTLALMGGRHFMGEFGEFLGEFTEVLREFHRRGADFEAQLISPTTAAVVVTTCSPFSVREATGFMADLRVHGIRVSAIVLNRTDAPMMAPEGEPSSPMIRSFLRRQLGEAQLDRHGQAFAEVLRGERKQRRSSARVLERLHAEEPELRIFTAARRSEPPQSLADLDALADELLHFR